MEQIPTNNDDRRVYRDDWGLFWRLVGWAILAFACLFILGLLLPPPRSAVTQPATTQPVKPESPAFLAIMTLGLAGWALYRRRIVLDRKQRTIRIRCGVGPFGWTWERSFDEFRQIVVYRKSIRHDQCIYYRVVAQGKSQSLTIGTIDKDMLFDSSHEASGFAGAIASFCGLKYLKDIEQVTGNDHGTT